MICNLGDPVSLVHPVWLMWLMWWVIWLTWLMSWVIWLTWLIHMISLMRTCDKLGSLRIVAIRAHTCGGPLVKPASKARHLSIDWFWLPTFHINWEVRDDNMLLVFSLGTLEWPRNQWQSGPKKFVRNLPGTDAHVFWSQPRFQNQFEIQFSVLIEMCMTSINFRIGPLNWLKNAPSPRFKSISVQSCYKLCARGLVGSAFKISLNVYIRK